MGSDITVRVGDGVVNLRVGAIITKGDRVLMVKNSRDDWYYSVGGRIQVGETSEQAIVREVREELGVSMEIDRLGFVHENYFYGTLGDNIGRQIYELCFFYYMKTPDDFEPLCRSATGDGYPETIEWVPFDTDKTIYPVFFKTELKKPCREIKHIISDER
ncbi:MAG: NUDIX domain-containing protein [Oscillospiraceae bacterium]|nr:NUDIX domain-containing protein [Oscillospiraceae bacterium]